MNKKLAAALSGGAVLVLALSGCTGDGDDKVDAWAKTFCDQAQPQFKKRAAAQQSIAATAADGKPADIQAADSKAFQDFAQVGKALAAAARDAGAPPIENGEQLQQDVAKEFDAAAKAYLELKKKVDALDAKDQQKFADGLAEVADGLKRIGRMDTAALDKLTKSEVGQAVAQQPGCKSVKTSSPAAGASSAPSPGKTEAAPSPSASRSGKASAKESPKASAKS
ncbi:small secreted protein [Streptomyces sp. NPDC002187]|uniref:small secreted protein n=1 Tax=Streptomyces sp. NPDC002187 TaxID=3364637 RepID=UPI0036A6ED76